MKLLEASSLCILGPQFCEREFASCNQVSAIITPGLAADKIVPREYKAERLHFGGLNV